MSQPYPGLRPYLEAESDVFFGQDDSLQALLERLNSQHFVTLLGLSGCGKSSLLNAGLLANIRSRAIEDGGRQRWLIAVMKPGNDPLRRLEAELEKLFPALPIHAEIEADSSGLARLVSKAGLDPRQRVLIVVDQFEELFRYRRSEDSPEREDKAAYFVKLLLQARRDEASQIYVLLAMRSEFLGDCATFYGLAEQVNNGTFLLPKMTRCRMEETIAGPLEDLNIGIDQNLVQYLLNETEDQDDGLPLLQHALRRTWECWQRRKQPDTPVSMSDFQTFISPPCASDSLVKHHLNDHLNSIYGSLTPSQKAVAERLFRLLSERDARSRVIRRPLPYDEFAAETGPEVETLIEAFRDVNLGRTFLMPPAGEKLAGSTVDISHECLLRRWDLLSSWVEAEARDARVFTLLAEEADQARRRELAAGTRKPLAGATLETYQAWRNQAQPQAAWARRYEGGFDAQLKRPQRQFAAAIEYLDWSVASRVEEEERSNQMQRDLELGKLTQARNQLQIANLESKRKKLKAQRLVAIAAVFALSLILFLVMNHYQQAATLSNLELKSRLTDIVVKNNEEVKATGAALQSYASLELSKLEASSRGRPDFAQTREVLQGVIILSNQVQQQSEISDDILKGKLQSPAGKQDGWLFLGVLDDADRDWAPNLVSGRISFQPELSKELPVTEQLVGRRAIISVYNNLRAKGGPDFHSQAAVIQILPPNTKMEILAFDVGTRHRLWAKVKVVQ